MTGWPWIAVTAHRAGRSGWTKSRSGVIAGRSSGSGRISEEIVTSDAVTAVAIKTRRDALKNKAHTSLFTVRYLAAHGAKKIWSLRYFLVASDSLWRYKQSRAAPAAQKQRLQQVLSAWSYLFRRKLSNQRNLYAFSVVWRRTRYKKRVW
jgi:hypothetical protein